MDKLFLKNVCKFTPEQPQFSDVNVLNFVFEQNPEISAKLRCDPFYKMHFIVSDEAKISYRGKEYSLKKHDLFFTFPGREYGFTTGDVQEYYVSFVGRRVGKLFEDFGISDVDFKAFCVPQLENSFLEGIKVGGDMIAYSGEGILLFAFSFIGGELKSQRKVNDSKIGEIKEFVDKNFKDENTTLANVCARFGYSDKYICVKFKQEYGVNFCKYLNALRINYANSLILSGLTNVGDVAFACGYNSSEYFAKQYKLINGVTPKKHIMELLKNK